MNKAINPPFIKVFTLKFTHCLILLLLTLFSIKIYAQQHLVLKLESKPLNIEEKIISKFIAHSHKKIFHPDSIIVSKDADSLFKYNFNRYFFTTQKKQNLNNYLNILTGTDSKNIPVLIIDKNFNNNFSDDSVYRFSISSAVSNQKEFYDLLPLIKIEADESA